MIVGSTRPTISRRERGFESFFDLLGAHRGEKRMQDGVADGKPMSRVFLTGSRPLVSRRKCMLGSRDIAKREDM